jgi:hypothetical protein
MEETYQELREKGRYRVGADPAELTFLLKTLVRGNDSFRGFLLPFRKKGVRFNYSIKAFGLTPLIIT